MFRPEDKRSVTIVSAVMRRDGFPDFTVTQVEVTDDDFENGVHFYLAEADLLEAGYEEPFVHFADCEAPPFLLPAVREYLASDRREGVPCLHGEPQGCGR